jgi:DNA-binding NarL/FixJ family response regulator
MEQTITVFIANDHTIVRNGIRDMLHKNPNIRVIGEAASFQEIFEKIDGSTTDILITDDQMPDGDLKESLYKIRQQWPKLKVIITSLFPKDTEHLVAVKHLIDAIINLENFETELQEVFNKS